MSPNDSLLGWLVTCGVPRVVRLVVRRHGRRSIPYNAVEHIMECVGGDQMKVLSTVNKQFRQCMLRMIAWPMGTDMVTLSDQSRRILQRWGTISEHEDRQDLFTRIGCTSLFNRRISSLAGMVSLEVVEFGRAYRHPLPDLPPGLV